MSPRVLLSAPVVRHPGPPPRHCHQQQVSPRCQLRSHTPRHWSHCQGEREDASPSHPPQTPQHLVEISEYEMDWLIDFMQIFFSYPEVG